MRKLRRKFSVWLLVFVMLAGTFSGLPGLQIQTVNAAGDFNGGSGTEGDPYQIATAEQFDAIRNYTDDDTYFILTADINLNNYSQWQPIGSAESESGFHLDGDGHTITNVSIDDPSGTNLGLFSKIDSSQTIKNLNITVSRIVGSENVGALAGINAGTITNVHVAGADNTSEIEGKLKSIGGLVGYNQSSGIIQKSSTSVQITSYKIGNSTTDFVESVGGLVGYNEGEVLESYSTSEFKLRSASAVGGLVGTNDGIIFGSNASGSFIHNPTTYSGYDIAKVGGLVGIHGITSNEALISFSYATGSLDIRKFDTTSHEWNTPLISHHGGLVGRMDGGEVYYSYARGNVKVHTNNQHLIGGLIGEVRANYDSTTKLQRVSKVHNTYATGNIVASGATSGSYLYYGALVGSFYRSNATTGYRNSNDGSIHSSYFLNATPDPIALGTGRTLEQLKDSAQFTGWDFDARWEIKPGVNDGHPVHRTGAVDVRVRPIAKESHINLTHPYTARVFVLSPDGPVSTALDWNVSGGTGVSIDQNGLVTVGEDAENVTYTIKAALQDKPSVFSEGSLSIIRPRVTGLSITPYTAEVAVGETLQLTTTVSVVGGASTDVTYESNSPTVLSVDETGLITVSKDARPSTGYRVTVRSVADPSFYHDKVINVRAPYVQSVAIKNKYSYSRVLQGGTITFEADVVKHGDITDEVTWKTNSTEATIDPDTGVLTVSEDATPGSQFTVTATSKADVYKSDSVTLRVQAVTGLTFYSTDHYVLPGGNINISPTVQVVEYAPTTVNWEYNEDIIESVESEYGVYKFKIKEDAPYGTYPLTARSTVKPTVFGTTNLQVHGNATSVEIVPTEITLVKNQKYQFNATVLGESSNIPQQVNWRPSNYSAISIGHYDGLATINASAVPGTSYTIIATSNLGSKTAEATITVAEISSVTLDQTEVTLLPGGTIDLEATVTASSEEVDKSIVWTSNNDDAVSVDNGVVTVAHDAPVGTYTITATSVDTSKAATATIHVVKITDVQVTPHTAINGNGTTQQFSALVLGEGNNIQDVIWSSNDTNNYVTVSESGLVTIDEEAPSGEYIITATSTIDSSKFGTATITVSSVTSVTLDETDVILLPGDTKQLVETVTVVGDVAQTVQWKSSDTNNKVTVINGLVTVDADAPTGTYYITATSTVDASKSATATLNVVRITAVEVTPSQATVHQGGEQALSAEVTIEGVEDSTLQEVTWTSDGDGAVTVDENGLVSVAANAEPITYTITATSKRDPSFTGTATIIVTAVTSVTVTPETKVLLAGQTVELTAEVEVVGNAARTVTWTSSDSAEVSVSATGVVTVAVDAEPDEYTITATSTVDGSKRGTAIIEVARVNGVTVDVTDASLLAGEVLQLNAAAAVEGSIATTIVWSSEDDEAVTVDATGLVNVSTNATPGDVKLTATSTVDASKKAEVTISVIKVTEVNITPNEVELHQGSSETLSAAVVVENGDAPEVTWSSSDSAVSVGEDGEVTVSADADPTKTYIITATSKRDPSVTGTATITVTAVTSVTVTPETKVLLAGQTVELTAEVEVVGNATRTVTWTSSDSAEVSVSETGVVTVAADAEPGEYTITATSTIDSSKQATAIIEVARVNGVTVDVTDASLLAGEVLQLNAAATVEGSIATTVVWSSEDDEAVTVDATGLVNVSTNATPGDVKLTATSTVDASKKAEVTISVIKVTEVNITPNEVEIHQGNSESLSATVVVENGDAPEVTWSSSDAAVSVNVDGEVTVSADADPTKTYTITATSQRDASVEGTAIITVTAVTGVTVTPETKVLLASQTVELTAEVEVVGNVARTVTWTSSDSAEVSVSAAGVVTVAADAEPGEYTITATSTVDGSKQATAIIEIAGVSEVTIDSVAINTLIEGESLQLHGAAIVHGNIATTVTWSSSNATAVSVDSDGLVIVASEAELGEYTITAASTVDPSKTAHITITVIKVNGIMITPNEQAILQGESASIVASVNISDGYSDVIILESTNQDIVTWSSSDPSAVTVSEEGVVTVSADADPTKTYTITATSKKDLSVSGITTISVNAVTGVTVSPDAITLWKGIDQQLVAQVTVVGDIDTAVIWSSSDEDAIVVSEDGIVSVVDDAAPGQYFVTATSVVDERQEATVTVNIAKINGVTLNLDQVMLQANETVQLQAIAAIEGEISDLIQWSSNSEFVTVDSAGNVTVLADATPGDYIITAASVIDASKYAQSTIKVFKVNSMTITPTEAIVHQGNSYELIVAVDVENGEENEVAWSSSNPDAVSVSNGIVMVSADAEPVTYTITATSVKNPEVSTQATIMVTAVVDVAITPATLTVRKGKTEQLSVTVNVVGDVDQSVEWSSSNTNFVTVTEEGLVSVLQNAKSGKYTITATSTVDNRKLAVATITVPSDVVTLPDPGTEPDAGSDSDTGTEPGEGTEPGTEANPGEGTVSNDSVFASEKVNREQLFERLAARAQQNAQAENKEFNDVEQHWANSVIQLAVAMNFVNGYADGGFKPNSEITRAEFAVIIANVFGIQASGSGVSLQDVEGHWAKSAIEVLAQAGIVGGYGDGSFRPNQTITREEIVIILSRIVNLNNVEKDTTKGSFADLGSASSYAVNTIQAAAQAGIISGKGANNFDPKGQATRAEALTIIINVLKLDKNIASILENM